MFYIQLEIHDVEKDLWKKNQRNGKTESVIETKKIMYYLIKKNHVFTTNEYQWAVCYKQELTSHKHAAQVN